MQLDPSNRSQPEWGTDDCGANQRANQEQGQYGLLADQAST